jgi:hypothetical protein
MSELQGAAQEKSSSLNTNVIVRETIAHYLQANTNVFVCLLDARKAYDTVWVNGLIYMLRQINMPDQLVHVITQLFVNNSCSVRINGIISEPFVTRQGIIQGGPLSLVAYELFNNGLLYKLVKCRSGTSIGHLRTTSPAFADDITLICPTSAGMQKLLDITYEYACKWRY